MNSDLPESDGDDKKLRASEVHSLAALDISWLNKLEASSLLPDTSWLNKLEASSLLPDTSWLNKLEASSLLPDTSWLNKLEASSLLPDTSWLANLTDLIRRHVRGLPANWSAVLSTDVLDDDKLRSIFLIEGIPLAWVPGSAMVERLLNAEEARDRRELIRNGWRGVLRDCERAAGELPSRQARSHARFIALSASAIRDGHYEAAQALSANLIDTLGRTHVNSRVVGYNWSLVTAKNQRPNLSKLKMRALMVLGPLAVGHTDYRPGDSIPRSFSRHATAHGVSSRQYTRVNSLIALMNATALLCWLERDSDAFLDA